MDKKLQSVIRKIARQTDNNDHTGSVLTLAEFLGDAEAIEELLVIKDKHNRAGCMETEWVHERSAIMKRLLNRVLFLYGEAVRDRVNGAF